MNGLVIKYLFPFLFLIIFPFGCGGGLSVGSNDNNQNNDQGAPPPGESMNALTADWNCTATFKEKLCDGISTDVEDYALEYKNFITTQFDSDGCSVDYLVDIDQDWSYFAAPLWEEELEVACKKEKNQKVSFNSQNHFQEDYCIWDYKTNATLTLATSLQSMSGTLQMKTFVDDLPDGTQCEDTPAEGAHCTSTYGLQCNRLSAQEKADLTSATWKKRCASYPEGFYPMPDECDELEISDGSPDADPDPNPPPPSAVPTLHFPLYPIKPIDFTLPKEDLNLQDYLRTRRR